MDDDAARPVMADAVRDRALVARVAAALSLPPDTLNATMALDANAAAIVGSVAIAWRSWWAIVGILVVHAWSRELGATGRQAAMRSAAHCSIHGAVRAS